MPLHARTPLSALAPARALPRLLLTAALAVGGTGLLLPEPAAPAMTLAASSAPLAAQDAVAPVVAEDAVAPVHQTVDSPIAFRTVRREDPQRYKGVEAVVRKGIPGVLRREYLVVGAAGTEVSRTVLSEEQRRAPLTQVVAVGTRPRPRYRTDLDWAALARCESGGDPKAVSRTGKYRGLYQFDLRTWRSVGGTGDPVAHGREEQTHRASRLYEQRGRSPWPHCGRHL